MAVTWNEDVALEIEALQATYSDELKLNEQVQQLSMLLLPALQPSKQHYVQCELMLTVGPQYPDTPPRIGLADVRGFQNRAEQLLQHLSDEVAPMAGELVLGHLFESAKAWLSEHNWPEGPCIFCLEDLAHAQPSSHSSTSSSSSTGPPHQAAGGGQQADVLRLPCFHAFHEGCFADWWCWQQQALEEQQRALEHKTGVTAAAALIQEQLPAREGSFFQLTCPTCRAAFSLQQDLQQHIIQQLQQQLQEQHKLQQQQQQPAAVLKLSAAQLEPFKDLQQRHAVLFAKQQQRQGIISKDSSYCIADWEGPAAVPAAADDAEIAPMDGSRRGDSVRQQPLPNGMAMGAAAADSRNASGRAGGGHYRGRGRRGAYSNLQPGDRPMQGHRPQQQQQQQQPSGQQQQHLPQPGRGRLGRGGRGRGRQQGRA